MIVFLNYLFIFFINVLLCDNEKTKKKYQKIKKIEISNNVGSQDNNIINNNIIINNPDNKNSNIRNISNEIDTNNGMIEKDTKKYIELLRIYYYLVIFYYLSFYIDF